MAKRGIKRAKLRYQRLVRVRPGEQPIVIERGDPEAALGRIRRALGRDWPPPRPNAEPPD
jgi:hypothetical protein